MIPDPVTLHGRWVTLEPLESRHTADLFAAAQDEDIWRYLPAAMPRSLADMQTWTANALAVRNAGQMLPFAIVERTTGRAIGSTRYLDYSAFDRHIEIGWTWLGRDWWRTPLNTECKYLLMRHAFETLACIRVQLKPDLRNERSQRAIERIGGVREGILRKAVIVPKDGHQRWSVYFSILDDEWSSVKAHLEESMTRP
ncbi:MAG: GNAT family N-acetyltransferase [Anaerolineae bacterium]|nr:GNAT family N-acetyltransferase [Anaerolineae bacterium]